MFEGSLVKKGKLCVLLLSIHVLFTMLNPWKRLCLKLQRLLSHVPTDYFFALKSLMNEPKQNHDQDGFL